MPISPGEAVVLDLPCARFPSRMLALLIDMAVQVVLLVAVLLVIGAAVESHLNAATVAAVLVTGLVVVIVGYPAAFETLSRGRTLGKLALGLRVVAMTAGRSGSARRWCGRWPAVVEFWALLGVPALITSMLSARGKRLGDMFAGTFVIQERLPRRPALPPALAVVPPAAGRLGADAGAVPAAGSDRGTASSYLRRFYELTPGGQGRARPADRRGGGRSGQPAPAAGHAAGRVTCPRCSRCGGSGSRPGGWPPSRPGPRRRPRTGPPARGRPPGARRAGARPARAVRVRRLRAPRLAAARMDPAPLRDQGTAADSRPEQAHAEGQPAGACTAGGRPRSSGWRSAPSRSASSPAPHPGRVADRADRPGLDLVRPRDLLRGRVADRVRAEPAAPAAGRWPPGQVRHGHGGHLRQQRAVHDHPVRGCGTRRGVLLPRVPPQGPRPGNHRLGAGRLGHHVDLGPWPWC